MRYTNIRIGGAIELFAEPSNKTEAVGIALLTAIAQHLHAQAHA